MQLATVPLICLLLVAAEQQPAPIRADVNLVEVRAIVTDSQGHVISGLTKDAFHLFVDESPQTVATFQGEDAPVTAGIVIDNSASMAPKRDQVSAAALAFARASNPIDQMFIVHFNEHARLGLPTDIPFTGDVKQLESAIGTFDSGGATAFYDALLLAESHFQRGAYFRKVLLTITDGGDNSSHSTLAQTTGMARRGPVSLSIPVGIFDSNDRDRNQQVLSKIAGETGGEAFFPKEGADVTAVCIRAANDIRQQYVLTFTNDLRDGAYHRIRLTASDPRYGPLQVRTRAGYFSNKPVSSGGSR